MPRRGLLRPLRPILLAAVATCPASAALAATPAGAAAATTAVTSSNWAGYAVRRTGTRFGRVTGAWTVPAVTCVPGRRAASANWIGLGGYSASSTALEQLGTESNCSASGHASYAAWFEVVPAPSSTSQLVVRPGDVMRASVSVVGHQVRLRLDDVTRGTSATRQLTAAVVDTTSAEWIVEAPSECPSAASSSAACRTTQLADVGSTAFTAARAQTVTGHSGTIVDDAWTTVALTLRERNVRGLGGANREVALTQGGAAPGPFDATAGAFAVTYGATAGTPSDAVTPSAAPAGTAAAGRRR